MGADSGGEEKMSVETTWKLFACITMSFLAYAVLRPLCCPPKVPNLPKPGNDPPLATIKIHPQKAAFKLFPPGEAHYLSGPKKAPIKKKKKGKLNAKLKQCVRKIMVSNTIRDVAHGVLQANKTCDVPNNALHDEANTDNSKPASDSLSSLPPPPSLKGNYLQPKDPNVFSAQQTKTHLNGGTLINTFPPRVQLRKSQGMDDKEEDDIDDVDPCTSSSIKNLFTSTTTTMIRTVEDSTSKRPSLTSNHSDNMSKKPEVILDVNKLGNHQIIHIS